jgi:Fuc2NAc and GlcNAc transferase
MRVSTRLPTGTAPPGSKAMSTLVVMLLVLLASSLLTWAVRRLAVTFGFLDHPNERSSHVVPTPQGGGVAIVAVATSALAAFALRGEMSAVDFAVLAGGGLLVTLVGLIDDWRPLSTHVRLAVHFGAASIAMFFLDGLPPILIGDHLVSFGWLGYPLGIMGIVWSLNLFNFMDGIDGLAASEGAFVAIAGALVLAGGDGMAGFPDAGLWLGAACCGFLVWNWPPARIFLGDAGSGYLGYSLVCLAIIAARDNPVALFVFVILGAVFVVDATVTFVRRIARNERYDVGHRTHGYQRLARRWGSHRAVTVTVLVTNTAVLLPAAYWAASRPFWAVHIAAGVLTLLLGLALVVGSGCRESS